MYTVYEYDLPSVPTIKFYTLQSGSSLRQDYSCWAFFTREDISPVLVFGYNNPYRVIYTHTHIISLDGFFHYQYLLFSYEVFRNDPRSTCVLLNIKIRYCGLY